MKNPRIKSGQLYCGCKSCQQARKNAWERKKLKTDAGYYKKRKDQKATWHKNRPLYIYQRNYRETHPEYLKKNRFMQKIRNQNWNVSKIVKTDTSASMMLIESGLYEIRPYKTYPGKKIVNTDALIVALRLHSGMQEGLMSNNVQL